jgi:hypothetical protein
MEHAANCGIQQINPCNSKISKYIYEEAIFERLSHNYS